jgi:filamentous hemagglutinin
MPLDDKGRYSSTVVLDGKAYEPKFHSCATVECSNNNANLDRSDPATQAYIKALDQQIFKDIGTGATGGTLVTPVGAAGRVLFWLGAGTTTGQVVMSESPTEQARHETVKAMSQKGAEIFFREVLLYPASAAARAIALIELAGGWDSFVNRVEVDLLGVENDSKK